MSSLVERGGGIPPNSCPAFRQIEEEQRAFLETVSSHLPSAQNNPYTKVAYLEGGYLPTPKQTFAVLLSL